jgi:ribonuclease VapC
VIVIDTSAIVAVLRDERERRSFTEAIENAEQCLMSAVSFVEASMLMEARNGYEGLRDLDLFLLKAGIAIEAVDLEQAKVARGAFTLFGKGRHEANLNFGDCFSYALAKISGAPLLFKGDDFSRTDIEAAVKAE